MTEEENRSESRIKASDRGVSSFKLAFLTTVSLRLIYCVFAAVLGPRLKLDPVMVHANRFTDNLILQSETLRYALLGVWERFDTLWYTHIAAAGYDDPQSVVFPPLYPWLIRAGTLLAGDPLVAALAIATVSSFLLFWALHRLALFDLEPKAARRAVILYAVWPAGVVFFVGYAESLVLAIMLWAIVLARSNRWWAAGILGFFAGLAKTVGFLVVLPLAIIALRKRSWRALPVLFSGAGYFLFLAWLYTTGRALPTDSYAKFWGTDVAMPWETIGAILHQAVNGHSVLITHVILVLVTSVAALSKRIQWEYYVYAIAALIFIFTKKSDPSQLQLTRYVLVLFPAAINLAIPLRERVPFALMVSLLMGVNMCFLWGFLNWWLVL